MTDDTFTHDESRFQAGDDHGGVDMSASEARYAELFVEIIWDGLITSTNRQRLENAREVFGVSPERAEQIERSLTAAHETNTHSAVMVEADLVPDSDGPVAPLATSDDPKIHALQLRIQALERERTELNGENTQLRARNEQLEELVEQLQAALQSTLEELGDVHEELDSSSQQLADTEKELKKAKTIPPGTPPGKPPLLEELRTLAVPQPAQSLTQPLTRPRDVAAPRAAIESEDLEWALPEVAVATTSDNPADLHMQLDDDPRDTDTLVRLFDALRRREDVDRRWCVAHALVYLGEANDEQRELCAQHTRAGMVKPRRPVNEDEWRELLFHPAEDPIIGDVLSAIASAVLVGQLTEARGSESDALDEQLLVDPSKSTVQAVRSFAWAAKILGLKTPPLYVDSNFEGVTEMVLSPTPSTRLGNGALVGRTNKELAFLAGQQLCSFRKEHLLGQATASARRLEDLLLAALSIGNPGLPMTEDVKDRVEPLMAALKPLLTDSDTTQLQDHFARFVEGGGTADIARWSRAVERTALCSGLLLANDLDVAEAVLRLQNHKAPDVELDELIVFFTAERCSKLRQRIGIAVTPDDIDKL